MNELDVNVIVSGTAPDGLAFAYQAADPSQPAAKYLDPTNGNISVPKGVTNLRIAFHLKPRSLDASFDLGQPAGKRALTIWTLEPGKSTKMTPDPPDFGPVGVSTANPPMSVSVIDRNQLPGPVDYEYQLVVGVRVNGVIHPVPTPDPKIRNGSDRIAISPWLVAGITVLVLAGLFALYAWNRNRTVPQPGGGMGGTPNAAIDGQLVDRERQLHVDVMYEKDGPADKQFVFSRKPDSPQPSSMHLGADGFITVDKGAGPVTITFHVHPDAKNLTFAESPFELYTMGGNGKVPLESTEFKPPEHGSDWPKSFTVIDANTLPGPDDPRDHIDYFYKLHFRRAGAPDLSTPDPKIRNGGGASATLALGDG